MKDKSAHCMFAPFREAAAERRVAMKNKIYHYRAFGEVTKVHISTTGRYMNGRRVVGLVTTDDTGPYMTASVNLPDERCAENEVWIKDWSENEGIRDWLIEHEIIGPILAYAVTGFVVATRHRILDIREEE